MRLIRAVKEIWQAYAPADALRLCLSYLRLLIGNRLARAAVFSRLLSFKVAYPNRATFFSQFTEIFLRHAYRPPEGSRRILDCGSNIGMSALFFAWQCPQAQIVCFEPNPQALAFLRENIEQNALKRVRIEPVALGKEDGEASFYVEPVVVASTGASLTHKPGQKQVAVSVRRLSAYIGSQVDYLKLDVEGAEREVIEDLQKSGILGRVRALCIECHKGDTSAQDVAAQIQSVLESEGFKASVRPSPVSAQTVMLDARNFSPNTGV